MKTKIVEHIVGNALHAVREAKGEALNMLDQHPALSDASQGLGLDFAVLREKLLDAERLLDLLT